MKRSVRRNVFETNSSSTHSLTICTEEDFNKWKNGEVLHTAYGKEPFISQEEAIKEIEDCIDSDVITPEELIETLEEEGYYSYESENYSEYLEYYEDYFTTPSGDKMVAFGRYGRDG